VLEFAIQDSRFRGLWDGNLEAVCVALVAQADGLEVAKLDECSLVIAAVAAEDVAAVPAVMLWGFQVLDMRVRVCVCVCVCVRVRVCAFACAHAWAQGNFRAC
jgi:hypothetical protein